MTSWDYPEFGLEFSSAPITRQPGDGIWLERVFDLLSVQPRIGTAARSGRLKDVRRVNLPRIRYHLYYRPTSDDESVEVLALWHSERGRDPKL